MSVARVKTVAPQDATGEVKQVYDMAEGALGMLPNVFQALSLRPALLSGTVNMVGALMLQEGALPRAQKEMIAVVGSAANRCKY